MRNIKRALFINHAFEKAKKTGVLPECLRLRDVFALYVLSECSQGLMIAQLNKLLGKLGRSIPLNEIYPAFGIYASLGLVDEVNGVYTVSLSGLNMLKRFDDLLRVQRFDRRKI